MCKFKSDTRLKRESVKGEIDGRNNEERKIESRKRKKSQIEGRDRKVKGERENRSKFEEIKKEKVREERIS